MKKNETVYLKDGRKANYESQIEGNKHLVTIYTMYFGYEDEEYEDLGEIVIVDEVFKKAPIQVVSKRIKELKERREKITKEVHQLNNDKMNLVNYISQNTKFRNHIINKKELVEAISIAFFESGSLIPTTLDKNKMRGIKIALNISIFSNEERAWGYKLYEDYGDYSGYIQDTEEDIIINPTDEILEQKIIERINKISDPSKFNLYQWKNIDNKYLTKELIEYKNKIIYNSSQTEKNRKLAEIEKLKKQLTELEKS